MNFQKGSFGLGIFNWKGMDAYGLTQYYSSECHKCDRISLEEAIYAEAKFLYFDLTEDFRTYIKWGNSVEDKYTKNAAYMAGYIFYKDYYNQDRNIEENALKRAHTAEEIYEIIMN